MSFFRSPSRAFTLIEVLVVVVSIIAPLVSILLPSLAAGREKARIVVCKTRLRELYLVDTRRFNLYPHSFYAARVAVGARQR